MEISPNIVWLDGGSSNLYLCEDEDGLTLVDTGLPGREDLVFDAVNNLGREQSSLVRILITHADADHAGSAAYIQEQTGALVYASSPTAELLRTAKAPKHLPTLLHWLLDLRRRYEAVPESAISICQDREVLPVLGGLRVMATPGHSHDHHAFYSPTTGVLFAGDALTTRGDRLGLLPQIMTGDIDAARRSAITLLGVAPAIFACGHGSPMSSHSSDDLMNLLNTLRKG
jgi:glyoxylase-like metal-dependent hydrolase (beta-lactamase superfamily II)